MAEVVVGHCLDEQSVPQDRVLMSDGTVRAVRGNAWRDGRCPQSCTTVQPILERRGLLRHGKVGHADCLLVNARDLYEARCRQLRRLCPNCSVQPRFLPAPNPAWPEHLRKLATAASPARRLRAEDHARLHR